jgi:hypothetical protein
LSIWRIHIWLFGSWQLVMLVLPLVLLAVFLPTTKRLRDWFQVSNLSNAAELAIKAGAIVAGVVALNVFQLKPHLTVDERCDARLNLGLVVVEYGKLANVPRLVRTTLKLSRKHQIGVKPIPLGTGKPGACGRPRADLFSRGSISVTHLTVIPTATSSARVATAQPVISLENGRVVVRTPPSAPVLLPRSTSPESASSIHAAAMQALLRALRTPPPLTPAQAKKASRAISRATTITVRAFVRNIGRGDATSVKVDQPPGLWLAPDIPQANCQTPPFDIDSGERAKLVCYHTSGRRIAFTSEDFKAFGDAKPKVDDAWLWAIGGALYVLVLGAIIWEIATRRWQTEQQPGGEPQQPRGAPQVPA